MPSGFPNDLKRLMRMLGCIGWVAGFLWAAGAGAATFTVTSTRDAGTGTLRDALTRANTNGGPDVIQFAIGGSGVHTIQVSSPLPAVTDPVVIDGASTLRVACPRCSRSERGDHLNFGGIRARHRMC